MSLFQININNNNYSKLEDKLFSFFNLTALVLPSLYYSNGPPPPKNRAPFSIQVPIGVAIAQKRTQIEEPLTEPIPLNFFEPILARKKKEV